jgi:hypothetical protein
MADRDLEAYCGACGASLRDEVEDATGWVGGWYWSLRRTEVTLAMTMWLAIGVSVLLTVVLRPFLGDEFALPLALVAAALAAATFLNRAGFLSRRKQRRAQQTAPDDGAGRAPSRAISIWARRSPARSRRRPHRPRE